MTPRKHAELIHYYADGGEIDFKNSHGNWVYCQFPNFYDDVEYRNRTEKKRYRVAKMRGICGDEFPQTEKSWMSTSLCSSESFVQWITEWMDFE